MEPRKKEDEEILFPEVEVAGLKLRPWTLGDLESLREEVQVVVGFAVRSGITEANISEKLPELIDFLLGGIASTIIAKTAKVDLAKARALPLDKATMAVLTIIDQNLGYLKNSYGLEKLRNLVMLAAKKAS